MTTPDDPSPWQQDVRDVFGRLRPLVMFIGDGRIHLVAPEPGSCSLSTGEAYRLWLELGNKIALAESQRTVKPPLNQRDKS